MKNNNNEKTLVMLDQASGYIEIDMLEAFKTKYDKLVLIAGSIVERNKKLDKDVIVEKIIKYNRSTPFKRIYSWVVSTLQMFFIILFKYRKSHLFIISNPPLSVYIPFILRNSFDLLIFDVYPDAILEFGIIKETSIISKIWIYLNKKVFKKANRIFTISEGMHERIVKYIDDKKIEVIPIWTDNTFFKPVPKEKNKFLIENNWTEKFLVIYSGNLGFTHDMDILVDVAERINDPDILFLIIGEGDKESMIREKIQQNNVTNCKMLPWQPAEILPYTMSAADIGVVSLGRNATSVSVPSKTYNLMSVGVPLMAIASKKSELGLLIDKYKFGAYFAATELDEMKDYILDLKLNKNKREMYSKNALFASKDFGPENAKRYL